MTNVSVSRFSIGDEVIVSKDFSQLQLRGKTGIIRHIKGAN